VFAVAGQSGRLLFANAAFLEWTGFSKEELVGALPPYPFWISHRSLYSLAQPRASSPWSSQEEQEAPLSYFPFRKKDGTVMWCRMEAASEELGKTAITVVFLHRMSDKSLTREAPVIVPERLVEEFPHLVLSVQPAGEIDFWDDRWEAATGLKKADLVGVS